MIYFKRAQEVSQQAILCSLTHHGFFFFLLFFLVISVHTPYQMVAVMHRRCLKTANRNSRRKKNKLFVCFFFQQAFIQHMYKQTKASICQLKSRILTAIQVGQVYLYVHLTEEEVVHFGLYFGLFCIS